MAQPPIDLVVHLPYKDSYIISGQDMEILKKAVVLKLRNEDLEREIVSLNQIIKRYQEKYGET